MKPENFKCVYQMNLYVRLCRDVSFLFINTCLFITKSLVRESTLSTTKYRTENRSYFVRVLRRKKKSLFSIETVSPDNPLVNDCTLTWMLRVSLYNKIFLPIISSKSPFRGDLWTSRGPRSVHYG